MKIPSSLPQFEKSNALIIVTGTKEADMSLANAGQINSIFHFLLAKTTFSDREDSARRGSMMFENGGKIELLKRLERQNFLKTIKEETARIARELKINSVYLFAPEIIQKELEKALPATLQKKIAGRYAGNYCKEKPLAILKKIKTKA